ncbi:MAG: Gx transporter family protein [Clostridia bacterium]|nr:Gx transporter family protein [Clostridia bacterium]
MSRKSLSFSARRAALPAILGALAVVLTVAEFMLPPLSLPALPGIRLGLANVAIIFAIRRCSLKTAVFVAAIKLFASALLSGTVSGFLFSAAGTLLSFSAMVILVRTLGDAVGETGVSVAGAFMHNVGQSAVSLFLFGSAVLYYLPFLFFSSVITGIVTGTAAHFALLAADKSKFTVKN